MREALRAKLEKEAKQSGTSINAVIVDRLESSFEREDLLAEVLSLTYGRQVAGILMMLGSAMSHAGINALLSPPGDPLFDDNADFTSWIDHPDAYEQAKLGVVAVLDALRPKGEVTESKGTTAVHVATDIIGVVRRKSTGKAGKEGFEPSPNYAWDPATVRSLLGPAILGRLREPTS
jgi:hypothetical protein